MMATSSSSSFDRRPTHRSSSAHFRHESTRARALIHLKSWHRLLLPLPLPLLVTSEFFLQNTPTAAAASGLFHCDVELLVLHDDDGDDHGQWRISASRARSTGDYVNVVRHNRTTKEASSSSSSSSGCCFGKSKAARPHPFSFAHALSVCAVARMGRRISHSKQNWSLQQTNNNNNDDDSAAAAAAWLTDTGYGGSQSASRPVGQSVHGRLAGGWRVLRPVSKSKQASGTKLYNYKH